jgi:osmoprotectant transport system ATP-binding protein
MIAFDHVSKAFDGRAVLDDVSLLVAKGEFCVIVGPSGAGKSTALRLVNRLIEPDSGSIRIEGDDIAKLDPVALRRRLGYVIQSIGLFPHWTVADNVATVPRLLHWPRQRIDARVDELLTLLGLDTAIFRGRYPHQLSGGQQQRVGVARALAADPDVLLMDEPFGALDAVTRELLQTEMARIHAATRKTILMVTHDVDEAIRLASRIVVLAAGRVVQNAPPEEILSAPANNFVSALFGGEAANLRLLKIRRVGDWLDEKGVAAGESIAPDETLETALARMLGHRLDALAVVDQASGPKGVIHLNDLVRRGP